MAVNTLKTSYIPRQFDIEKKNNFEEYVIPIGHPLYGVVWKFYEFDDIQSDFLIFPDACIDVVFRLDTLENKSYFLGAVTSVEPKLIPRSLGKVFGCSFVTGSMNYIFHLNACELNQQIIALENLLPNVDKINQQLIETTSFPQRIEITSQFFLQNYEMDKKIQLVNEACTILMNHEGNFKINDLSQKLGYSTRYIRTLFLEYVGITPKLLNEILRLQFSFQSLVKEPNQSLSEVAWNHGYYDLSHMSKNYVSFSNMNPKELLRKLE